MPYSIRPDHPQCPASKPWGVVKVTDGTLMGCHPTKGDAQDQITALNLSESERNMGPERRFFPVAEIRAAEIDGESRIVGYAAVYNSMSEDLGGFREIVLPGFFDDVLADDIRSLYNHNPNLVLGRTTNGTLSVGSDELGLRFTVTPPDTSYARDLATLLRRGDVNQTSFSWDTEEDRWEERPDGSIVRYLVKARRLYDVGPVTFPAYPMTSVQMRSMMNIPEIPAGMRGASVPASDDQGPPVDWQGRLDIQRRRLQLFEIGAER